MTQEITHSHVTSPLSETPRPPTPYPEFLQSLSDHFDGKITHQYPLTLQAYVFPSVNSFQYSNPTNDGLIQPISHHMQSETLSHAHRSCSKSRLSTKDSDGQFNFSDIISTTTTSSEIPRLRSYCSDMSIFGNFPGANCNGNDIATLKDCIICANHKEQAAFSSITPHCRHEHNVCNECVARHIQVELFEKGNYNILCPNGVECQMVLHETDVKVFASDTVFQRYQLLSLKGVLSQMPDFRWCTNPRCEFGQIYYQGDGVTLIMTCVECGQKSCVIHNVAVHDGSRCAECNRDTTLNSTENPNVQGQGESPRAGRKFHYVIKRLQKLIKTLEKKKAERAAYKAAKMVEKMKQTNEKLSCDWITFQTKACPECKYRIQKDTGCDHMTCRCGHEFCWLCFADYNLIRDHGNQYHDVKCRYHT